VTVICCCWSLLIYNYNMHLLYLYQLLTTESTQETEKKYRLSLLPASYCESQCSSFGCQNNKFSNTPFNITALKNIHLRNCLMMIQTWIETCSRRLIKPMLMQWTELVCLKICCIDGQRNDAYISYTVSG
jgi:hypothetical protein